MSYHNSQSCMKIALLALELVQCGTTLSSTVLEFQESLEYGHDFIVKMSFTCESLRVCHVGISSPGRIRTVVEDSLEQSKCS